MAFSVLPSISTGLLAHPQIQKPSDNIHNGDKIFMRFKVTSGKSRREWRLPRRGASNESGRRSFAPGPQAKPALQHSWKNSIYDYEKGKKSNILKKIKKIQEPVGEGR
jgi:hypothetical protein